MKFLKMLVLVAATGAALLAAIGAGSATATTTLCKTTESACSFANMWPEGETFSSSLVTGTKSVFTPDGELPTIECSGSSIGGITETTTTPEGKVSTLTFTSCNNTVEILERGKFQIHWDVAQNGELTISGMRIRTKAYFGALSCDFGGTISSGITMTSGGPAKLTITASVPMIQETGIIPCPLATVWHGEYTVSKPDPLYVNSGV